MPMAALALALRRRGAWNRLDACGGRAGSATLSNFVATLMIVVLSTCTLPAQDVAVTLAPGTGTGALSTGRPPTVPNTHLITAKAVGPIRLTMTLDDARRALPTASFTRSSDGDGAALVAVRFRNGDALVLWAGEEDPASPVDWSKKVVMIEAFSAAFHTGDGTHPGSLVRDVAGRFGPVQEIIESEIESRQYITFQRQPAGVTFRLDYTGIFPPGTRSTNRFSPGARIMSISVSSMH
jgi:hypothetical protein